MRRRLLAALALAVAVALPCVPTAADDIVNWSGTDASNNRTPPNGFPEGMFPSQVDDAMRAVMGAIQRDWADRPVSIRQYGAKLDGATDDGPAINSCFAAVTHCFVPTSTAGAYVHTPVAIPAGDTLSGTTWSVQNGGATNAFAGQSWILCDNTSAITCVTMGAGNLQSGAIDHVIIAGKSGTPASGAIGLKVNGGYNISLAHTGVYNEDTCVDFLATNTAGIAAQVYNPILGGCQTHYLTVDGWPEVKVIGGRFGMNGAGDYAAQDYVYLTDSACTSAGCGPNTVVFLGTQFNTGTLVDGPSCWLRVGNITSGGKQPIEIRADGVHIEALATNGHVLCTDSTVTKLQGLQISNSWMSQDNSGVEFFGLNAATALWDSNLTANQMFIGTFTLSPAPTSGAGLHGVEFVGNTFGGPVSITTNGTADAIELVGNHITSSLTYASASAGDTWFSLMSIGNSVDSAGTDVSGATGSIEVLDSSYSQNKLVSAPSAAQSAALNLTNKTGNELTVANGANGALVKASGEVIAVDLTSGQAASYICGGGGCSIGTGGAEWVQSTTTPASGKSSIQFNGTQYAIYNNTGASVSYSVGIIAIRNGT